MENLDFVKLLLERAIKRIYDEDEIFLINHKPNVVDNDTDAKEHVGERTSVFRIAYYFQNLLIENNCYSELKVDCEYNRYYDGIKTFSGSKKGIVPDMVLHNRNNQNNNILVCEFKGYWNNDSDKDKEKIEDLCSKEGMYRYKIGAFIKLNKESFEVTFFNCHVGWHKPSIIGITD